MRQYHMAWILRTSGMICSSVILVYLICAWIEFDSISVYFLQSESIQKVHASAVPTKLISSANLNQSLHLIKNITMENASPYIHALSAVASSTGEVLLALVDQGFVPMAINFFLMNIKPYNIDNYLILTMHPDICKELEMYQINCFHYRNFSTSSKLSRYGGKDFKQKMNVRTDLILDALEANITVLHSDIDVIFFSNPFMDIVCPKQSCDMAILMDTSSFNAGFLLIHPSEANKNVYKGMQNLATKYPELMDQTQLNRMIAQQMKHKNGIFKVTKLSKDKYQCGLYYYENAKRYFADTMKPCSKCVVAHNNWIVGLEAKIYRFKELHQWMYDGEQYYTSDTNMYLSFDTIPDCADQEQKIALKSALAIAKVLGRILILPKFYCKKEVCPLNSVSGISQFDKQFNYRENSFLSHPLVPHVVKSSIYGPVVIKSKYLLEQMPSMLDMDELMIYEPADFDMGMNENEVVMHFGNITQSVLHFHSMYRAFSGFVDDAMDEEWNNRCKAGLVKGSYRQF